MMDKSRAFLRTLGLPGGDLHALPTSEATFPGGAQFGVEIPTVNTFAAAKALLRETQRFGVTVNRIDETLGAFRHTRAELLEYAALCRDSGAALTVSIGPRAAYDTSATRLSRQGAVIGYRLRGEEQLVRALEDAKRVCDLGIRGCSYTTRGCSGCSARRGKPASCPRTRCSRRAPTAATATAHRSGCSSSAAQTALTPCAIFRSICSARCARAFPFRSMSTPTVRRAPAGSSAPHEAPEIVRCCAPVYLKIGNSALAAHGSLPTEADAARMAQQAAIVMEMLERYLPEARQLARGEGRGLVAEAEVRV